jgi:FMN phosphatase YigB (HAD superfamily)
MVQRKNWMLDFDETLATGGITWGLKYAFPRLINEHNLPYDVEKFEQAVLVAQEQGSREYDPTRILSELFSTMGWPHELEAPLLTSILTNYQPELFDDVIPFLERLLQYGQNVYVLSNNPRSPKYVELLQLSDYISHVFTPSMFQASQSKPHRSLWDEIVRIHPEIENYETVLVGDDPWSDGVFAENCGLFCWIVDRMDRFRSMHYMKTYSWVRSLSEIAMT